MLLYIYIDTHTHFTEHTFGQLSALLHPRLTFSTAEARALHPAFIIERFYPRDLRTHILRLLGSKTILYKAFGLY